MSGTDQDSPVKRALLEIRRLREQLHRSERRFSEPIAIVGMGCRFPGEITDPAGFWDFLEKGGDAITEVPADRWDIDAYYDPDPDAPGKISTRWGGFLRGIDLFDPEFFGISAREAATLDPQQRLLLEVSWEALEDASIAPDGLLGSRTGVFTGMGTFDYLQLELKSLPPTEIDPYFATGGTHSVASGRISYLLGLKGPNVTVDTACSASLVAVHLACQSLRLGECDLGLAGGVSILLLPEMFVDFSRARMMAADGRCKVFDAAADGYVRAEGCGVVVLKRLSDAVADGDRILALIRGSAINHDGRSNGLTAPNGPSQVAVIRNALEHAGVDPARVGYVEAHGTGTSLGDPIEVHALAEALGPGRAAESPLVIGSLKSNLGHLEAAAGIAGLMKIVLCLQHRAIPHSLHFSVPNPRIAWERLPVEVARAPREWPSEDPRVAGVSSFGFSGTNAHVLVEEYCPPEPEMLTSERPVHLLTVSAKSESALAQHCRRIASALRGPLRGALADAAFSLNTGRAHFPHRIAVMGVDSAQVAADLDAAASGDARPTVLRAVADAPPAVCFLFTGQGSQVFGIGRALYETEPAFRDAVHRCDAVLAPLLGRSITSVLYTETDAATRFTQPAIVTIELALTELWRAWGIRPAAVLGHSLGEYAAAIVASVLSVEDGLRLVAERARLVEERCVEGRMLAVGADADRTREVLATYESGVEIAALNGPDSVVVAGAVADVERSAASLERRGIRVQLLDTTRAFHHALLEPALIELDAFARTLKHGAPSVPMLSTLTGGFFEEGVGPTAGYWANQARRPVRFHDACLAAVGRGVDVFLEVGPAATLTGLARQALLQEGGRPLQMLTSLRRGRRDFEQMLESLAALHVCGAKVDWRTFDQPFQPRKCALPTYPFQRKRYWFDDSGIPGERRTVETKSSVHRTATELDAVAWTRSLSAARRQAAHVPIDLDLGSYGHRWRVLERLTIGYIVCTLRDLGLFVRADEEHRPADIVRSAAILPMYATLLERWLERLTAECLLERRGDAFAASAPLPTPDVEEAERQARAVFADAPYVTEYLTRCGALLTAVVTGAESALETLFPGGSRDTAVALYRTWPMSRYFNEIIASAAASLAVHLPPDGTLELLEIGAGTGGTTACVLPLMPAERTRYCFTDVSEFFFSAAAAEFAEYAFVEYGVLNIERAPCEQGYGRNAFHAVIAANVLHATSELERTVDHVLSLLRPGGLLLLYEVTEPKAWIDTSVALIAGWAKFSDGLRDNGPLLSAEAWRRLLLERGFIDVEILPGSGTPAHVLGMSIVVARAPSSETVSVPAERSAASVRSQSPETSSADDLLAELRTALPIERLDLLVALVREHVSAVLRRGPDEVLIDRRRNLMELGVDSLMAIELRDRLGSALALKTALPASLIFDYPNIEAIAQHLGERAGIEVAEQAARGAARVDADDGTVDDRERAIEEMSDDEIEAMLLKKLERG